MMNWLRHPGAASLVVGIALWCAPACRPGTPVIDMGSKPPNAMGTISGTVRGPQNTSPIVGRTVTAIDIATGARIPITTGATGGYTVQVPPGRYRLEVALLPGETLTTRPDDVEVSASDLDPGRDFVITQAPR